MAEGVCLLSNCVVKDTTGSNPVFSVSHTSPAHVAKLEDASGLGSDLSTGTGSSPVMRTRVRRSVDRSSSYGLEGRGFESFRAWPRASSTWWLSGLKR